MSVTDDIAEEIVEWCLEHDHKEYSHVVIIEDHVEGNSEEIAAEIEKKLKEKGISVGP